MLMVPQTTKTVASNREIEGSFNFLLGLLPLAILAIVVGTFAGMILVMLAVAAIRLVLG